MKVLMIGLGGAGQRLLRVLSSKEKGLEVIAFRVKKRSPVIKPNFELDSSKNIEDEYDIQSFNDLEQALNERPDIAVIANPTSEHLNCALPVIKQGCSVLMEKPLSHDLTGVQEFKELVKSSNASFLLGYNMRFHPVFDDLKAIIEEKRLGNPVRARVTVHSYLPDWHKYEDYRQLYAARKDLGGGVILTESHELDYCQWLFGEPARVSGVDESVLGLDVEDTVLLKYYYDSGLEIEMDLSFAKKEGQRLLEVEFEKGSVLWDWNSGLLKVKQGSEVEVRDFSSFERIELFEKEVRHFLDCVKNGAQPLIGVDEAVKSLQMCVSAKKALKSKEKEVIEW